MRCETSFFSLTLYKKHLNRYWPMWAVWLAAWMLILPVSLWRSSVWRGHESLLREAQEIADAIPVTGVIIGIVAPVVAVAVFFHLFRAPAANFVGALPLRREGAFATAFAAGYTMLAAPLVVVTVAVLAVEWALNVLVPGAILTWLAGCLLQSFFWFSFATLCCVISGNAVASVSFYAIFNGVVIVMVFLVQSVLSAFLYGFDQFGETVWETAMWLTPIYKTSLPDYMLGQGIAAVTRFEMLWIYAAVGFLMLLCALGLHHIRKAERTGDLIAFGPIRWLFRISVTLCGGLAFGMLLMVILFHGDFVDSGAYLAGCCAVAAVVSWFVAEMLLQKSFKVFKKHWKGAVVGAVCFIVAICAIDMDWIGFTTRVPQPQQVRSAQAYFYGEADPIARNGLTYDAETVKDLIALHQYLVDHRDEDSGNNYGRLELEYDLGLTSVRRVYSYWYPANSQVDTLSDAAQHSGKPDFDISRGVPHVGDFSFTGPRGQNLGRDLTTQELAELWAAVVEDVEAGRYHPAGSRYTDGGRIEFQWIQSDRRMAWQSFYVRPEATSVNAAIQRLNLMNTQETDNAEYIFLETVG